MRYFRFLVSSIIGFLLFTLIVSAQTSSFRLQPFLSGLSSPLLTTNARDGSKRLFVVQQGGIIKVVQPSSNVATDFLNITPKVLCCGERGLLGLAFHPQFTSNGYFFVNYTRIGDGATVIARYKTTDNTNALGDPNSERIVLVIPQPFANHNGGMIEFGPDGYLYIGMGDGGSANDPQNNAQNINSLLGKFLRITPDVSGNNANPAYTVPTDNPFVGVNGADEIYAVGMRNPFRWSFDRGGTRQLWAGDVGQGALEEVDIITKGGNYGWRVYEGTQCTNLDPALCNPNNFTPPIFQYSHTSGRCSVTGGYVYRGTQRALPDGAYTYADYCTGEIWMWYNNQQILLQDTTRNVSSFGEDEDGELYVVGLGGTVEKIVRAKANADFDGDAKTDFSVFRLLTGTWYILNSSNNAVRGQQFGQNDDIPTPEDYDGDNITDIGVFRPSSGTWYYINSSNNTFRGIQFGQNGDIPAAGDYDGDAKADISVFRQSNGIWYRLDSSNNSFFALQFGTNGDVPTPGDFDGDGKYDIAVFRPLNGTWYRVNSANSALSGVQFGASGDVPAQGDFDGDGRIDQAVYRPNSGIWYILRSTNGAVQSNQFGAANDVPAVGDYDGDGREDIAVFRPENGTWYALQSSNNTVKAAQFGASGDLPAPFYDKP
ncbi:MAG: PQQ-dependent sugar dehydrogenase [Pyrinomonadaceae bacterium]